MDKIKSANKLNSNILQIGQVLLIPVETTDVTETTPSTSNGISYVVVKEIIYTTLQISIKLV